METAPTYKEVFDHVAANAVVNVGAYYHGTVIVDDREYQVKIEADDMSIMDEQGEGVWCGQLEWSRRTNDYGYAVRPEGFDGNAEILERSHGSVLWWQPMDDCKPGTDVRASVRREVCDTLEYGYRFYVVTGPDGESESLGGCSPNCDDDEQSIELVADLHHSFLVKQWEAQWFATDLERFLNYGKTLDKQLVMA